MRLFVAAWPSEEVLAQLEALPRPERPEVRWTRRDQWHVTVRFFGEVSVDEGVMAGRGVAEAAAAAHPVVAELGPKVDRFGPGVLQVPVAGLEPVAKALAASTAEVGSPPDPRPFSGHVTLARSRGRHSLDGLTGTEIRARWTVHDVALVASVASRRAGVANHYEVVATFPLG